MKKIRAKFTCHNVERVTRYKGDDDAEAYPFQETIKLSAVADTQESNKDWAKFTPSGSLDMTIDNPRAQGFFKPGRDYYIDVVAVDDVDGG